jgi:transposase InsO family protein
MQVHRNAALGVAGRLKLVRLVVEDGFTQRQAARALGVSPATANRWVRRWQQADTRARQTRACLGDRPSRPHTMPRMCPPEVEARIVEARRRTNLGPVQLARIVGVAASTIWKVLHRLGASRAPRAPRPVARRYEWQHPGALIHVDVARLPRFRRPGHRTRSRQQKHRSRGAGHTYVHVAVDDHSRYAYLEQHADERAATCAAFLDRALRHFAELGMHPPEAVMTDNALAYRHSTAFSTTLTAHGARHITTPPYTPRWNGKAERFIQTMKREWAYAHEWPDSTIRARALNSWLRTYNRHRPHSSLGGRPPISRVHNLCEQDN